MLGRTSFKLSRNILMGSRLSKRAKQSRTGKKLMAYGLKAFSIKLSSLHDS